MNEKILVISVIGIGALSILSGCGSANSNAKTKQNNDTEQLLPAGKKKKTQTSESKQVDKKGNEKDNN